MAHRTRSKGFPFISTLAQFLLLGTVAHSQSIPLPADTLSRDQLVCALDPQCSPETEIRTRGIVIGSPDLPPRPPAFDNITFEFNSATLTPQARAMLDRIGDALHDPRIERVNYRIEGHTDAKGSFEYNQALSERRAEAVRQYLVSKHRISEARLDSVGLGKTQLLPVPPAISPFDGINRRVVFTWSRP
jgi:outer membrane protein OmpA-like peptidoglycan-associated protein